MKNNQCTLVAQDSSLFEIIFQIILNKKNKTNLTIIGQNPNSTEEKKYAILIYKAKSIEKPITNLSL